MMLSYSDFRDYKDFMLSTFERLRLLISWNGYPASSYYSLDKCKLVSKTIKSVMHLSERSKLLLKPPLLSSQV